MFAEPEQPSFDGGWLEFGRHHACRHGGVVNLNYGRQISLNSITDDHFVQGTVHTATKLDSAAPYSTFTAYVSSSGSALRRGTSLAYASNRSGWSPLGGETRMSAMATQKLSPIHLLERTLLHLAADFAPDWAWAKAEQYFPSDAAVRSRRRFL